MTARLRVFLPIALLTPFGCSTTSRDSTPPRSGSDVVAKMIEAHGGSEKWRSAPTVSFQDALQRAGVSPMISRVTVEQGARRAYLDFP